MVVGGTVPVALFGLILAGASAVDASGRSSGGLVGGLNLSVMPAAGRQYAPWYVKSAAQCPGKLTPAILAAQGWTESLFNPNAEGPPTQYGTAKGIAQFIDTTWPSYAEDADGDGTARGAYDPEDAIMAQGKYMCKLVKDAEASGYSGDPVSLALAGYNAGWGWVQYYKGVPPERFAEGQTYNYVREITANAKKWATALGGPGVAGLGTGSGPDAIRHAYSQLGIPYAWGGGTPGGPGLGFCDGRNGYLDGRCSASVTKGFDCSSLAQFAWWPSVKLPRTAADQYAATASRPVARGELKPGDLVFWSKSGPAGIYHVGLYFGDGQVLHAPRTGKTVSIQPMDEAMPKGDYVGATRPGA
ncbi:bifunctional lytic transglycosylase/C40 family peptidase [Streptomyces sp. NBC_01214]|uniref:C40 family peptidase n=1 Tax=Streptomyces sp. NBC_01214 TaxID=2903777 RepID=UPI0022530FDA|nr:bifunctional lytic transglycosylase/C40 family peptidase [Streptomyces sp. NBC_01214]MCX4808969.1 bifunctional lytic transglycosylase/C40 family peptidase [Streptomyces sp. NBC_01214]